MTRRRQTRRKKEPRFRIDPARQREIVGLLLLALAGTTVLSLLSVTRGRLTEGWLSLLRLSFGWGYILVPLGLGAVGFWLVLDALDRRPDVGWERPLGAVLLFLVLLSVLHLLARPEDAELLAANGAGGGYFGWLVSRGLVISVGSAGASVVLVSATGVGLIMLFGISIADLWRGLVGAWRRARGLLSRRETFTVNAPLPPAERQGLGSRRAGKIIEPSPGLLPGPREAGEPQPVVRPSRFVERAPSATLFPRIIGGTQEWRLPPLADIFENNVEVEISQQEIRARVKVIEDTLRSFGVPAKVVEVNQGPTITQFGVEPGYVERKDSQGRLRQVKVKVSKISSLADDLALALSASPVRIQAPVPGRPVVGIEVPNAQASLVGLKGILESEVYQSMKSKLKVALGQDVAGRPIVADLATMPHLLIAGATGSGKSVCINAIIACLLCQNIPDDLRMIMVDPKRVELTAFNGIPHLLAPVVVDVERVVGILKWVTGEMDGRYKKFAKARARDIESFNEMAASRSEQKLPYIVVLIDELADLMIVSPDEVERLVCRIAQMARATGIHLVMATQRPSVDVVTGLIKANFPARISFAVTSQIDSRVILDGPGAEKLLGRGDMLYMASDSSELVRLQGSFVSDTELRRLIAFWKGSGPLPGRTATYVQPPLLEDVGAQGERRQAKDDLWDKALSVIREHDRASISLLQRRLRIGYSRAARLMDLMEEEGIVGPPEGAGKSRRVLIGQDKLEKPLEVQ